MWPSASLKHQARIFGRRVRSDMVDDHDEVVVKTIALIDTDQRESERSPEVQIRALEVWSKHFTDHLT